MPLSVTKGNCKAFWEVGVIDHVRTVLGCRDFFGCIFYNTYFKTGFHTMITILPFLSPAWTFLHAFVNAKISVTYNFAFNYMLFVV